MGEVALSEVMDGLAGLATVANVYAWPVKSLNTPAIVVGYPTEIDFDLTFQRGGDRVIVPVWYVVGDSMNAATRDLLSDALAGAAGFKDQLDGVHSFGSVGVASASIETVAVGGVDYIAIRFECEVLT